MVSGQISLVISNCGASRCYDYGLGAVAITTIILMAWQKNNNDHKTGAWSCPTPRLPMWVGPVAVSNSLCVSDSTLAVHIIIILYTYKWKNCYIGDSYYLLTSTNNIMQNKTYYTFRPFVNQVYIIWKAHKN